VENAPLLEKLAQQFASRDDDTPGMPVNDLTTGTTGGAGDLIGKAIRPTANTLLRGAGGYVGAGLPYTLKKMFSSMTPRELYLAGTGQAGDDGVAALARHLQRPEPEDVSGIFGRASSGADRLVFPNDKVRATAIKDRASELLAAQNSAKPYAPAPPPVTPPPGVTPASIYAKIEQINTQIMEPSTDDLVLKKLVAIRSSLENQLKQLTPAAPKATPAEKPAPTTVSELIGKHNMTVKPNPNDVVVGKAAMPTPTSPIKIPGSFRSLKRVTRGDADSFVRMLEAQDPKKETVLEQYRKNLGETADAATSSALHTEAMQTPEMGKALGLANKARVTAGQSWPMRRLSTRAGKGTVGLAAAAAPWAAELYSKFSRPDAPPLPKAELPTNVGIEKPEASKQVERNALLRPLEKKADLETTAALTGVAALLGLSTYGAYKLMRKLKSSQPQVPQYNTAISSPTSVLVDKIDQGQA
jgi:hypothetical protein